VAVAAPQRTRRTATIGILATLIGSQLAIVAVLTVLGGGGECRAPGSSPTQEARNAIPATALAIYQQAGQRHDIDWAFLASIGAQECDHGRCAGADQINPSGCWPTDADRDAPRLAVLARKRPDALGPLPTRR
jgi:hypothetical protein